MCSSCINDQQKKCIRCNVAKKKYNVVRRNIHYILFLVALWFVVCGVYPFPIFFALGMPVDPVIMQPILISTGIMLTPFIIMMFVWNKRPPS